MTGIAISPATQDEKPILRHLMELLQYDYSEYNGQDIGPLGLFGYNYLDHYWIEEGRYPFLIRFNGQLAGFVLVNRHACMLVDPPAFTIAEFFVMRKYRKLGIGRHVAAHIFDQFPGRWEVRQTPGNIQAQTFWRRIIEEYTGGNFEEFTLHDEHWHGPVQVFDNSGKGDG